MSKYSAKKVGKLTKPVGAGIKCQVSEKGALSIYGLNARFPVTLYWEQVLRVLSRADSIIAFMEANSTDLADKPEPKPAAEGGGYIP